jgi:hypothetical protein
VCSIYIFIINVPPVIARLKYKYQQFQKKILPTEKKELQLPDTDARMTVRKKRQRRGRNAGTGIV